MTERSIPLVEPDNTPCCNRQDGIDGNVNVIQESKKGNKDGILTLPGECEPASSESNGDKIYSIQSLDESDGFNEATDEICTIPQRVSVKLIVAPKSLDVLQYTQSKFCRKGYG